MVDDQRMTEPECAGLHVILDPFFALGTERAEQENCAFVTNENVGSAGQQC
jgi:hypothetical protein